MLERSKTCSKIITDLQQLKRDKKNVTYDKCKLELEEHKRWSQKHTQMLQEKYGLITDFKLT